MRLVCLLAFYDERPQHLARLIHTLPLAGVTHLVAYDGAYGLYNTGCPSSPVEQHDAITQAARETGISLTLRIPGEVFAGNEVQKRTELFAFAEQITSPTDWLIVLDADETVEEAPDDLHDRLRATEHSAADHTFIEHRRVRTFRKLFRAERGLHVAGSHDTYRTGDGRNLWGRKRAGPVEPGEHIPELVVRHHISERHPMRNLNQRRYYRDRDRQGIEI